MINDRVTYVWLFLAILTGLSWYLSDGLSPETAGGIRNLAIGLLALAFFKTRLVIMYFMEVLEAPWLLRGLMEAWVVLVFLAMCTIYVVGPAA